jgi:glutamate racemase
MQGDEQVRQAPIGVFDSGVGGLSVAREIAVHLPAESICYLADTAHVPYGERSDEDIRRLTSRAAAWLAGQGCKTMVVACNTASAFSLTHLREQYGERLPIIGLVPAVKPAVLASRSGRIGVLATPGTLRGNLLREVIAKEAVPRGVEVLTAVSPALVPLIEAGQEQSAACEAELARVLDPLLAQGVDQLVLGCTHYPFLRPVLARLYGPALHLVDSGAAVARQTGRVLAAHGWLRPVRSSVTGTEPDILPHAPQAGIEVFVTGHPAQSQAVVQRWVPAAQEIRRASLF